MLFLPSFAFACNDLSSLAVNKWNGWGKKHGTEKCSTKAFILLIHIYSCYHVLFTDIFSKIQRLCEPDRHLWRSPGLSPCLEQGPWQQAAQGLAQLSFDYLQGWILHSISGQPVLVCDHPHSEHFFFFFLIFKWNFLWFSLCLLPLICLWAPQRRVCLCCLYCSIRYLCAC